MVIVRSVLTSEFDDVRNFATKAVVYVHEGPGDGDKPSPEESVDGGPGARLAEDDSGILGYAQTRLGPPGRVEAELTLMLIAPRARQWAVDRLLVDDARRQAAGKGATVLSVMVRPPVDAFFRGLGARVLGISGSWGGPADPRIHLEFSCSR